MPFKQDHSDTERALILDFQSDKDTLSANRYGQMLHISCHHDQNKHHSKLTDVIILPCDNSCPHVTQSFGSPETHAMGGAQYPSYNITLYHHVTFTSLNYYIKSFKAIL
jgi:hypothetical protein